MRAPISRPWIFLSLILAVLAIDALFIEPYRLQVNHYQIQGAVGTPLKIADLSDLHTRGMGRRERRILQVLEAERPDAIFITGDSLAGYGGTYEECRKVYEQLHAPLGVWFVRGNWENDHPVRHEKAFYQAAGVHLLVNANAQLRPGVWLIGFDDLSGTPRANTAFADVPDNAYKIALFHSPAYFPHIAGQADLVFAGHTHGGQVRLPLVRPFWLPNGSGHYLEGWYQQDNAKMYVNRGVGMSLLPIRFRCRPEIAMVTIQP